MVTASPARYRALISIARRRSPAACAWSLVGGHRLVKAARPSGDQSVPRPPAARSFATTRRRTGPRPAAPRREQIVRAIVRHGDANSTSEPRYLSAQPHSIAAEPHAPLAQSNRARESRRRRIVVQNELHSGSPNGIADVWAVVPRTEDARCAQVCQQRCRGTPPGAVKPHRVRRPAQVRLTLVGQSVNEGGVLQPISAQSHSDSRRASAVTRSRRRTARIRIEPAGGGLRRGSRASRRRAGRGAWWPTRRGTRDAGSAL